MYDYKTIYEVQVAGKSKGFFEDKNEAINKASVFKSDSEVIQHDEKVYRNADTFQMNDSESNEVFRVLEAFDEIERAKPSTWYVIRKLNNAHEDYYESNIGDNLNIPYTKLLGEVTFTNGDVDDAWDQSDFSIWENAKNKFGYKDSFSVDGYDGIMVYEAPDNKLDTIDIVEEDDIVIKNYKDDIKETKSELKRLGLWEKYKHLF